MYRESDHIHVLALTNALNVSIRIVYMDRTDQEHVTTHNFPEDKEPLLHILYRPGHYDILYE
jgi:ubiquitin thioesterase protein OTUB1